MAFTNTNLMMKWNPVKPVARTMGSLSSLISRGSSTGTSGGTVSSIGGTGSLAKTSGKKVTTKTTEESEYPKTVPPATYIIPTYTPYIPTAAPTYTAPTWDEGAIESLTQKKARPGLRELRSQIQRISGQRYDNPQIGRMTLREALQGYGAGIGSVLSGAGTAARGEYGQQYGILADVAKTNYSGAMSQWSAGNIARSQAALTNYQSELERRKTAFETAWNKWKSGRITTTTGTTE